MGESGAASRTSMPTRRSSFQSSTTKPWLLVGGLAWMLVLPGWSSSSVRWT